MIETDGPGREGGTVLTIAQPEGSSRFATVEDLDRWIWSASDDDIVAAYEESCLLSFRREGYGRELIEAATARLATCARARRQRVRRVPRLH